MSRWNTASEVSGKSGQLDSCRSETIETKIELSDSYYIANFRENRSKRACFQNSWNITHVWLLAHLFWSFPSILQRDATQSAVLPWQVVCPSVCLSVCRVAGGIISIIGLCIHAPVHLLIYLFTYSLAQKCYLWLACDPLSWLFSEWFVFRFTAFDRPWNNKCTVLIVLYCGIARFALLQKTARHLFLL